MSRYAVTFVLLFCQVRSFTTDNINMINDIQLGYYLTLFKAILIIKFTKVNKHSTHRKTEGYLMSE